jgi:hypothetical protein
MIVTFNLLFEVEAEGSFVDVRLGRREASLKDVLNTW